MVSGTKTLTQWDEALLSKHLSRYRKLESGKSEPRSESERHFVETFQSGKKPTTQHEIAYYRFKLIEVSNRRANSQIVSQNNLDFEGTVDVLDGYLISTNSPESKRDAILTIKKWYTEGVSFTSSKTAEALAWLNPLIAESNLSKTLERFTAEKFNSLSNEYTKAIDGVFAHGLKAGEDYISPTLHRLIIEGHTLPDAFIKVRDALPDDTFYAEIKGTLTSLASDMSSVVGLPIVVLGEEGVDEVYNILSEFGITKNKFADLFSGNLVELVGSVVPALAVLLSWNDKDIAKFSSILGHLGVTSAYAGNPFGLLIVIVGLAKSYQQTKDTNGSRLTWAKSLGQGGVISTISIASMNLLGPIVWTTLIVGIISLHLFRQKNEKIDIEHLSDWIAARFTSTQ